MTIYAPPIILRTLSTIIGRRPVPLAMLTFIIREGFRKIMIIRGGSLCEGVEGWPVVLES